MLLDVILLAIFAFVVFWAARRGFFVTVLRLGAWIVSIAVAQVLGNALAQPLYNTFAAEPARRMIAANLDQAIESHEAAQYAQRILADLPQALSQLAERVGGVAPDALIDNLSEHQFTTQNAAQLLEQSIIAPIATAIIRLGITLLVFIVLLFVCRLIIYKLEHVRRLPLLKQADGILGAALGIIKGGLLLFMLVLVLQAAAALSQPHSLFAQTVDASFIVRLLSF